MRLEILREEGDRVGGARERGEEGMSEVTHQAGLPLSGRGTH